MFLCSWFFKKIIKYKYIFKYMYIYIYIKCPTTDFKKNIKYIIYF